MAETNVASAAPTLDSSYIQSREEADLNDASAEFIPPSVEQDTPAAPSNALPSPSVAPVASDPTAGSATVTKGKKNPETGVDIFSDVAVQSVGGVRDAFQGIVDLSESLGDALQNILPIGGVKIDDNGVTFIDADELSAEREAGKGLTLPDVPQGRSIVGNLVRGVVQFVFGMKGVGNAMKLAKVGKAATKTGTAAQLAGEGAIAEFLVTEKDKANLSNLIQEFPALENPITEFLAADEDDGTLEEKLKAAASGALAGVAATGVIESVKVLAAGLRAFKASRRLKTQKETGFETEAEREAAQFAEEAGALRRDVLVLGDPTKDITVKVGSPKHVVARNIENASASDDVIDAVDVDLARQGHADPKGTSIGGAVIIVDGRKFVGVNHADALENARTAGANMDDVAPVNDLFITDKGEIITAKQAKTIAAKSGQLKPGAADRDAITSDDLKVDAVAAPKSKTLPNFARIDTNDDIDLVLQKMEADNAPRIAKAKGGVVSQAETHAAGQEMGWKDLLALDPRKHGITAARLDALKDFYAASAKMVRDTAELAASNPTEGNLFAFRKSIATHEAFLDKFAAARSEAGRALNILSRVSKADDIERLIGVREIGQELGGREATELLAKQISAAKGISNEALNSITKRGAAAKTLDAAREAWTLGLVSGLRTQGRNILSNFAFMLTRIPERAVAARLPGSTVQKGEALATMAGYLWATKAAFVNTGKAFWNGTSGFGIGKVDLPRGKAIGGELFGFEDGNIKRGLDFMGEGWRVWGRMLVAGDEMFKTFNYNGEIFAQSLRRASQEVDAAGNALKGKGFRDRMVDLITNPDEQMRMAARAEARRATFTQEPGEIAKAVLAAKQSTNPAVAIPATIMAPFVTTIANISKTGISYTPLAVLMPKTFWKDINKGGAAKDLALAKLSMGSMAMSAWSDFVFRGQVTGNGPSDPKERQRWIAAGHQPYSVLIGDRWVDYRTIEPIGTMLGIMADVTEKLTEYSLMGDSGDPDRAEKMDKLAIATVAAVGNTVNSQSFTRGLSEVITVLSQPDMYAGRYLQGLARSTVPNILRTGQELLNVKGVDEIQDVRTAMEAIDARLSPGNHISIYDSFGHKRERRETIPMKGPEDEGNLLSLTNWLATVSPVYVGSAEGTPIAKEIWEQGIRFNKPTKRQTFGADLGVEDLRESVDIDLRSFPKAWARFQELAGNKLIHPAYEMGFEALANAIVKGNHELSEFYFEKPDGHNQGIDDKGAFLLGLAAEYRSLAKAEIMNDPEFSDMQNEIFRRAQAKRMRLEGSRE